MKRHNLKILKQYYEQQVSGLKNFELRRLDRDFRVGDLIKLNEIDTTEKLGEALLSISKSTCCGDCQEAKRIALSVLAIANKEIEE